MSRLPAVAFIAAGLLAGTAVASHAQDWQPTFVDGVLQPLPSGFPDRPITLINSDEAGTHSGLYIRAIQEALRGISPVEIRISDEPRAAGGTIHAVAEVAETRDGGKDGYFLVQGTSLGSATDFLSEPVTEETGLEFDDINFLISTEFAPWVILQRKEAPWGVDFAGMVEHAKANPGTIRYISGGVGAGLDLFATWIFDQVGIEVNKIPAADREAALAAIGGGAGDIGSNNVPNTLTAIDRVDVIMITSPEVPEAFAGPGVVGANDYERLGIDDLPWGSYQGFLLSNDVPAEHAAWLHALIAAAAETDFYKQREQTIPGLVVEVIAQEDNNRFARMAHDAAEPIVRAAGLHWEDNR